MNIQNVTLPLTNQDDVVFDITSENLLLVARQLNLTKVM